MRENKLEGNDIGIFFCWGVKYGLAENNTIEANRVGISIGHRDTDNLVVGNTIQGSTLHGLLFRPERGPSFAGHRNRIAGNTFVESKYLLGVEIEYTQRLGESRHTGHRGRPGT